MIMSLKNEVLPILRGPTTYELCLYYTLLKIKIPVSKVVVIWIS